MNMATIKPIEARSVHQIQSGQVIVDLCSVAKELVENSLDAGATSIGVRFKNNGLDLIEVQDNGGGISQENYENVALKHYTSKLSSYDDLSRLHTFGFRGEALSSLCALSDFHIITAQDNEAPKANRLEFEMSGKLKKTQIVAGQKGTTASVEGLFKKLPVRRRELEKNIKREYGKVLNLLHAYACISTGVRFSVKNTVGKTRNVVVFSTNGNQTTKDNIANVYGAKTLLALIPLELELEFEPSIAGRRVAGGGQGGGGGGGGSNKILVRGHISRPVFGEGRQTPDRQMFFVNSRPCGLPQIAKAFNEVYKSFNVSQSPFVFADFQMDTNAYDVNVSPDKRTILLHDAGALIDSLKVSLTELFETSDQTVPQSQIIGSKSSTTKQQSGLGQRTRPHIPSGDDEDTAEDKEQDSAENEGLESSQLSSQSKIKSFMSGLGGSGNRESIPPSPAWAGVPDQQEPASTPKTPATRAGAGAESTSRVNNLPLSENGTSHDKSPTGPEKTSSPLQSTAESQMTVTYDDTPRSSTKSNEQRVSTVEAGSSLETPNAIQNAFDRMRPRRMPVEVATITVGDRTVTSMVGSGIPRKRNSGSVGSSSERPRRKIRIHTPSRPGIFGKHMKEFAAPGSQMEQSSGSEAEEEAEEEEEEEEEEEGEDIEDDGSDDGSRSYSPSDNESNHSHNDIGDQELPGNEVSEEVEAAESVNEEEKKKREEAKVQQLIQEAEEKAALPQEHSIKRANKMNKGAAHRDSTVQLVTTLNGSLSRIQSQMEKLQNTLRPHATHVTHAQEEAEAPISQSAEDRLSLTVTKDDFAKMRIIGQFNLGFILATRASQEVSDPGSPESKDELFIIDQHASDEKFNFERLQAETIVQNQRLVQPKVLDLTAVEEEIVIENQSALEKNGFVVEIDDSGNEPIGRRCKLVSLPLSKEVVFGVRDLEELIVLLSEIGSSASQMYIPRPSKVRKMFAMRACRSSIMIGKNLTQKQMVKIVRNMGTIDKPWNCPHGRPTMRHLMSLGQWNEWDEFENDDEEEDQVDRLDIWKNYLEEMGEASNDDEEEEE